MKFQTYGVFSVTLSGPTIEAENEKSAREMAADDVDWPGILLENEIKYTDDNEPYDVEVEGFTGEAAQPELSVLDAIMFILKKTSEKGLPDEIFKRYEGKDGYQMIMSWEQGVITMRDWHGQPLWIGASKKSGMFIPGGSEANAKYFHGSTRENICAAIDVVFGEKP